MFLAASVSPDGLMVALCVVLVSETWRGDKPVRLLGVAFWLGLAKPPYFLLTGAGLLLWLWRGRRGRLLPAATALAVGSAVLWSRWANHVFVPYRPIIAPRLDVRHVVTAERPDVDQDGHPTRERVEVGLAQDVAPEVESRSPRDLHADGRVLWRTRPPRARLNDRRGGLTGVVKQGREEQLELLRAFERRPLLQLYQ